MSSIREEEWTIRSPSEIGLEETITHIQTLLSLEKTTKYNPSLDYLSFSSKSSLSPFNSTTTDRVNEAWRRKLCEWCFEVTDHFQMERDVVSIAMNYLDRVIAKRVETTGQSLPKREFQLMAVTCLYIAVKLHGETEEITTSTQQPQEQNEGVVTTTASNKSSSIKLNIDVFVELSRGFFQAKTIQETELKILFALDWNLNPPTPMKFIASFIRMIPMWKTTTNGESSHQQHQHRSVCKAIFDIAMYLTELSVCVSTFSFHSKNSIVAYAAILSSIKALDETSLQLQLPYDIRVEFLKIVAQSIGLTPSMQEVQCVQSLLTELCPALLEPDGVTKLILGGSEEEEEEQQEMVEEEDDGSASPFCVISHGTIQRTVSASNTSPSEDVHVISGGDDRSRRPQSEEPQDVPQSKRGRF